MFAVNQSKEIEIEFGVPCNLKHALLEHARVKHVGRDACVAGVGRIVIIGCGGVQIDVCGDTKKCPPS